MHTLVLGLLVCRYYAPSYVHDGISMWHAHPCVTKGTFGNGPMRVGLGRGEGYQLCRDVRWATMVLFATNTFAPCKRLAQVIAYPHQQQCTQPVQFNIAARHARHVTNNGNVSSASCMWVCAGAGSAWCRRPHLRGLRCIQPCGKHRWCAAGPS